MTNTASSLTENKAFAERIFERIKDGLGDLMTDAELKVLLHRAIEEAFFTPRTENYGYSNTRQIPSYFVEMTRDLLKGQVQALINEYFEANRDDIKVQIAGVLQEGIGKAVLSAIQMQMQMPLQQLQSALYSKGLL